MGVGGGFVVVVVGVVAVVVAVIVVGLGRGSSRGWVRRGRSRRVGVVVAVVGAESGERVRRAGSRHLLPLGRYWAPCRIVGMVDRKRFVGLVVWVWR